MTPPRRVGVTERLARWCSTHPRRTVAAWGAVIVAALAAVVLVMAALSSEGHVVGNPHSRQAEKLIAAAFPPDPHRLVSDIIVVRSTRSASPTPPSTPSSIAITSWRCGRAS